MGDKVNRAGYEITKPPYAPRSLFEDTGADLPEGEPGQILQVNDAGEWEATTPEFSKTSDLEALTETVEGNTETLRQHAETLNAHTDTLEQHTEEISDNAGKTEELDADLTALKNALSGGAAGAFLLKASADNFDFVWTVLNDADTTNY